MVSFLGRNGMYSFGVGDQLQRAATIEKLGKSIRDERNRKISGGDPNADGSDMNKAAR